jgi:hypothetical protein
MKPIKVWSLDRRKKFVVVYDDFEDLITKGKLLSLAQISTFFYVLIQTLIKDTY